MSKLISYYFKRDKWILLAMVGLGLLGSFLLWGYTEVENAFGAISVFVGVAAFFIGVSIIPLWLCIRDYKRMYGAYGSFFAALPLTGKDVMGGRFLWFLIVQFVAFLGTAIFIGPPAYRNVELYEGGRELMYLVTTPIGVKYLTGFILLVIASILFGIAAWVFVTSVGSEKPFRRFGIGGPIMLYIGLQVAINVVTKVVIDTMGSQRQIVSEEYFNQVASQLFFRTSLVLSGLMLIAAVVLFLRSVHSHDKKLSVS
ncbi:hypothetical protein [Aedoeadaptatus acetigenes]|uniref:hypothetical protein n=1 Tax=Aedoeadaptatus acetigenes TaxID=2981723 RepID=UPI0011DDE1F1|nr:hypothetical protein [Aedoeadaptatus acetigenes]MCU6786847.1 hypothetical protein [Aedoeadaptatus acetigenes]